MSADETNIRELGPADIGRALAEQFRKIYSELVDIDTTAKTHARNANDALRSLEARVSRIDIGNMAICGRLEAIEAASRSDAARVAPLLSPGAFVTGLSVPRDWIHVGRTLEDNEPANLFLLPGEFKGTWGDARAWAEKQGGVLPSRIDMLVLWNGARDQFKQEAYWTSEEYARAAGYAWFQHFGYGYQYYDVKDTELRARAVRRLSI